MPVVPARRTALVRTTSPESTRTFAAALAAVAVPGDRIALLGDLGAGKTQFAKGFAQGLGVTDVVNSPSFTLMAEYQGRLRLFHLDLYRLAGSDEVLAGGLFDERQAEGVTLMEWAERLAADLDPGRLTIVFEVEQDESRVLRLSGTDEHARYVEVAEGWREAPTSGAKPEPDARPTAADTRVARA
jgi:tRNA threonylcarbamoyladenosine biosynthesis protein TsaE